MLGFPSIQFITITVVVFKRVNSQHLYRAHTNGACKRVQWHICICHYLHSALLVSTLDCEWIKIENNWDYKLIWLAKPRKGLVFACKFWIYESLSIRNEPYFSATSITVYRRNSAKTFLTKARWCVHESAMICLQWINGKRAMLVGCGYKDELKYR